MEKENDCHFIEAVYHTPNERIKIQSVVISDAEILNDEKVIVMFECGSFIEVESKFIEICHLS